ncbi:lytic transglycosylase domain-containing protein [Thiobacter sp. AK1]|uniref:Lytic transglycosylase domain-containing protein n=1 Tax=Thiobacter aerophilum TaxID=3121275 RepID=A0ABV0EGB7_9BURK
MDRKWQILTTAVIGLLIALLLASKSFAACFNDAAARYRVPPSLLMAISRVESGGNPNAVSRNADGSYDIGHMQINSRWLPVLQRYGITERNLFDACTNTYVGAWILAQNIHRLGYGWDAIGAYNASSPSKRMAYARKVAAMMKKGGAL